MWNQKIEETIRKIGESARGYKIMHMYASAQNLFIHNTLMYTTMGMGGLSAILSSVDFYANHIVLKILVICITIIASSIVAIVKVSRFDQKSETNKTAAAKYTSLEGNIWRQLSLEPADRVGAREYVDWISKSFDDLFEASPLLDIEIYRKYIKYAKKNNLAIPEEYTPLVDLKKVFTEKDLQGFASEEDTKIEVITREPEVKEQPTASELVHRSATGGVFPELKKFCDGKMAYEMKRLMRGN